MQKFTALFTAAFLSAAAMAGANDDQERSAAGSDAEFAALDRNEDQRISKSEASEDENISSQFASLDADSDGYVTETEFAMKSKQESEDPY